MAFKSTQFCFHFPFALFAHFLPFPFTLALFLAASIPKARVEQLRLQLRRDAKARYAGLTRKHLRQHFCAVFATIKFPPKLIDCSVVFRSNSGRETPPRFQHDPQRCCQMHSCVSSDVLPASASAKGRQTSVTDEVAGRSQASGRDVTFGSTRVASSDAPRAPTLQYYVSDRFLELLGESNPEQRRATPSSPRSLKSLERETRGHTATASESASMLELVSLFSISSR